MHSTHPMHLDESLDPALSFHSVEGSRKFPGQKVPNRLAAGTTAAGTTVTVFSAVLVAVMPVNLSKGHLPGEILAIIIG